MASPRVRPRLEAGGLQDVRHCFTLHRAVAHGNESTLVERLATLEEQLAAVTESNRSLVKEAQRLRDQGRAARTLFRRSEGIAAALENQLRDARPSARISYTYTPDLRPSKSLVEALYPEAVGDMPIGNASTPRANASVGGQGRGSHSSSFKPKPTGRKPNHPSPRTPTGKSTGEHSPATQEAITMQQRINELKGLVKERWVPGRK